MFTCAWQHFTSRHQCSALLNANSTNEMIARRICVFKVTSTHLVIFGGSGREWIRWTILVICAARKKIIGPVFFDSNHVEFFSSLTRIIVRKKMNYVLCGRKSRACHFACDNWWIIHRKKTNQRGKSKAEKVSWFDRKKLFLFFFLVRRISGSFLHIELVYQGYFRFVL